MEFVIGLFFIGVPLLLMLIMIAYMANKMLNHKAGITKDDYPLVAVGGKMKRVHPNSYFAKQARKNGLIK